MKIDEDFYKNFTKSLEERGIRKNKLASKWGKNTEEECSHNKCPNCHGTGIREDGTPCIHMISCRCPKCNPRLN